MEINGTHLNGSYAVVTFADALSLILVISKCHVNAIMRSRNIFFSFPMCFFQHYWRKSESLKMLSVTARRRQHHIAPRVAGSWYAVVSAVDIMAPTMTSQESQLLEKT